jgi:hypothetical protein
MVDAGEPKDGASLVVAMVSLPKGDCISRDVWLASDNGTDVKAERRLTEECLPSTFGVSLKALDHGEVRYSVGLSEVPGVTTFEAGRGLDFAFDPPSIIRRIQDDSIWDLREFSGQRCAGRLYSTGCGIPALTLPLVDVGDEFSSGGWRTTKLGQCSMRMRQVSALMTKDALYIEVRGEPLPKEGSVDIRLDAREYETRWTLGLNGTLIREDPWSKKRWGHVEVAAESPSVRRFRITRAIYPSERELRIMYRYDYSASHFPPDYGIIRTIDPSEAVCAPSGGSLQVIRTAQKERQPWEDL